MIEMLTQFVSIIEFCSFIRLSKIYGTVWGDEFDNLITEQIALTPVRCRFCFEDLGFRAG